MEDLSLHILDLVENSIEAGAGRIDIEVVEDLKADRLTIKITDDGRGMDSEVLKRVFDPFFTTKTVRRVGLGLSLFRDAARQAGGDLSISSQPNRGTRLKAVFQHSHVDRQPLGDLEQTLITLVVGNPRIRFRYQHKRNEWKQQFDSAKLESDVKLDPLDLVKRTTLIREQLRRTNKKSTT